MKWTVWGYNTLIMYSWYYPSPKPGVILLVHILLFIAYVSVRSQHLQQGDTLSPSLLCAYVCVCVCVCERERDLKSRAAEQQWVQAFPLGFVLIRRRGGWWRLGNAKKPWALIWFLTVFWEYYCTILTYVLAYSHSQLGMQLKRQYVQRDFSHPSLLHWRTDCT